MFGQEAKALRYQTSSGTDSGSGPLENTCEWETQCSPQKGTLDPGPNIQDSGKSRNLSKAKRPLKVKEAEFKP